MARKGSSFEKAREFALALPDVEEGTAYGSPAFKVGGKMFACIAIHRSAEPNTLAVRIPVKDRDELIAADPATFYVKEHYVDYACVLARLASIPPDMLKDLLGMGWRFVSSQQKARRPRRTRAVSAPRRRR